MQWFVWSVIGCGSTPSPTEAPEPAPAASPPATEPNAPEPAALVGSRVFFVAPTDGAVVPSPVQVAVGAQDLEVRPAGAADAALKSGHFVVVEGGPIPVGATVDASVVQRTLSGGEAEVALPLPPGPHDLTVQFVGADERSFGPALSATIHVQVQ